MDQIVSQPLPREFRRTLGCFPTGVAVVTTVTRDNDPIGVTVNSFSSVSLDPPLILWSLARTAWSLPHFVSARSFGINILARHQQDICIAFSRNVKDRFEGVSWHRGIDGIPILDDTVATLQCRQRTRYDGGDHEIFVGQVLECRSTDHDPLMFYRGQLGPVAAGSS